MWVLVGGSFLIAVGFGLVAPALPTFARSFNVGVTAASVVISAFAFVRLAFAPVSGRLVTRFGERPTYLVGIAIVAAGSLACAFAAAYWQLLLFRSLSGVGSTMFTVSANGLLIRIAPAHLRGRITGLFATSFLLGSVAGPALGGGLVALSLRAPFLIYGVALLVVVLLVWLMLRHSTLAARASDDGEPTLSFRAALRHPSYRAALASAFANGWLAMGARVSLIPLFVTGVLGQPASFAGVSLAVFAAGEVVALLFSGRLADSKGRKPLVIIGMAGLAAGTVLLGQAGQPWFFLLASLLAGLGAGTFSPAQSATVADLLGRRSRGGGVLAGVQMLTDVGAITGPLIAGVLAESLSFSAAFWLSGAVGALVVLVWLTATETLPQQGSKEARQAAKPCECPERPAG